MSRHNGDSERFARLEDAQGDRVQFSRGRYEAHPSAPKHRLFFKYRQRSSRRRQSLNFSARSESPEQGGNRLVSSPEQISSTVCPLHGQACRPWSRALQFGNGILPELLTNWSMCWMMSRRAKGPGVLKPRNPEDLRQLSPETT